MCVLAIAWRADPRWQLVVAANRDEYHDRPAAPLARWPDRDLIAGRDLRAGGTWLGVSERGRFAAVTNLRGHGDPDPRCRSRGALVADLVAADDRDQAAAYNAFNALAVGDGGARFLSNRPVIVTRPLATGLHALSNGPLDPPWRKTMRLKRAIERWLTAAVPHHQELFAALRDPSPPAASADDPSAIFVDDPVYGTRCSTVVTVDRNGAGIIAERRYDNRGRACGDTRIAFAWPPAGADPSIQGA